MLTRLKRELYEFLIKERISLETNLVNDFLFQMAGISLKSSDEDSGYYSTKGFSLGNDYSKNEDLKFHLPKLPYLQLLKLLDFLKFPVEKYETNSSISLDETFVFKSLLPAFKKYFEEVKLNKPSEIAKYIVKSKPILEASANSTLREYTYEVAKTILDKRTTEPSKSLEALLKALFALNQKVSHLQQWPILYKSVIDTAHEIADFKSFPEVSGNTELLKLLNLINEGIELFAKYNRCESVLANQAFFKEMETFLNGKKITSSLCNIVEDTLLSLAGAKLGINGTAHVEKGYDASRLVFSFTDIDKENTAKIVDYLQKIGDDTATEGYGTRHYGSSVPKYAAESSAPMLALESASISRHIEVEEHSIETDGRFFYEVAFPKLKAAIAIQDEKALDLYCKKSEAHFAKKDGPMVTNGLFKPVICTPTTSEIKEDIQMGLTM